MPPVCDGKPRQRCVPVYSSVFGIRHSHSINPDASASIIACMQAADAALHRRLPQRLVASWRNGYGAVRSKTLAAPRKLTALLRPCLSGAPLSLAPPPGAAPVAAPVPNSDGAAIATAAATTSGGASAAGGSGVGFGMEEDKGGSGGESQSGRAAAATMVALEEVVEAITVSVVSQVRPGNTLLLSVCPAPVRVAPV